MNKKLVMAAALVGLALVAACAKDEPTEGLVARAGEFRLTVDDAVELLVDQENLPNDVEVVRALAELWADYALLAAEAAEDSTLAGLDLEPLVRQQLDQEVIFQLRDSAIEVDTLISDADLLAAYQREAPDSRLRASHILMTFPGEATAAQRDSVRVAIEGVRRRALAGESFAALARQFSQDPGTAQLGGSLGDFGRGDMVKPFEDAAFALQPGGISDVVETPYGLHVIRLEGKEAPGFEQVKEQFRVRVINQRFVQAESAFVAGVEEQGAPTIEEGAEAVVREVSKDPTTPLSRRAARRALVSFAGGAVTAQDFRSVVQSQQPQFRAQVEAATDEQIQNFLKGLAQREMLVAEAGRRGLAPSQARVDSLVAEARLQLRTVAADIGLVPLERAPDEKVGPAVGRAVRKALTDVLMGAKDVLPLGLLSFQLREKEQTSVYDAGLGQVVLKVGQVRAGRGLSAADSAAVADTTGN
ncbi:MAG TPA: peptidylprolyl isomerase [Longimicrobiales bacterium]|nr:peptidylprolyl isomerase [Longimicrobiales bacterium]